MSPPSLTKGIGFLGATAMVVGTIIGASIFVQPSVVTAEVGSVGAVAAAWAAAGLLTLVGALVMAELTSAFPRTGGVYVFLSEAWGPGAGFLWGWAMLWIMHAGIVAAIAAGCARYVGHLVPLGAGGTRLVAVAAILLLSGVNYLGVRLGGAVQTALTVVKVGAVLGLAVLLLASRPAAAAAAAAPVAAPSSGAMLLAIGAGLFAFGGWHMVTYAAGETRDAERTIPRALMIGVLVVTVCYIALNLAYFHVLTPGQVGASRSVAADAIEAVLGRRAGDAVAVLVIVSTLGALNGVILAGPRVYYAMAQDRLMFRPLAAVHPAHRTPHVAILVQALWSSLLVASGSYDVLFGRVVYTEGVFFAAVGFGLLKLRARPGYAPAWRMPAGRVLAIVFATSALAIALAQVAQRPLDGLAGLALVASGIPVYLWWARVARRSVT